MAIHGNLSFCVQEMSNMSQFLTKKTATWLRIQPRFYVGPPYRPLATAPLSTSTQRRNEIASILLQLPRFFRERFNGC